MGHYGCSDSCFQNGMTGWLEHRDIEVPLALLKDLKSDKRTSLLFVEADPFLIAGVGKCVFSGVSFSSEVVSILVYYVILHAGAIELLFLLYDLIWLNVVLDFGFSLSALGLTSCCFFSYD